MATSPGAPQGKRITPIRVVDERSLHPLRSQLAGGRKSPNLLDHHRQHHADDPDLYGTTHPYHLSQKGQTRYDHEFCFHDQVITLDSTRASKEHRAPHTHASPALPLSEIAATILEKDFCLEDQPDWVPPYVRRDQEPAVPRIFWEATHPAHPDRIIAKAATGATFLLVGTNLEEAAAFLPAAHSILRDASYAALPVAMVQIGVGGNDPEAGICAIDGTLHIKVSLPNLAELAARRTPPLYAVRQALTSILESPEAREALAQTSQKLATA